MKLKFNLLTRLVRHTECKQSVGIKKHKRSKHRIQSGLTDRGRGKQTRCSTQLENISETRARSAHFSFLVGTCSSSTQKTSFYSYTTHLIITNLLGNAIERSTLLHAIIFYCTMQKLTNLILQRANSWYLILVSKLFPISQRRKRDTLIFCHCGPKSKTYTSRQCLQYIFSNYTGKLPSYRSLQVFTPYLPF